MFIFIAYITYNYTYLYIYLLDIVSVVSNKVYVPMLLDTVFLALLMRKCLINIDSMTNKSISQIIPGFGIGEKHICPQMPRASTFPYT